MDPKPEKPLRLFVNPFALWTQFAFKTGEAMLASAHAAALRVNPPKVVAVLPAEGAPPAAAGKASSPARRKTRKTAKRKARR